MIEERYSRSADMRLLDLRRKALGITTRKIARTVGKSTRYGDLDWLPASANVDESYVPHGTILNVNLNAQPYRGVIPGAQVTVSLTIANDGDAPASNARIMLPLPIGTEYAPGSLQIDGLAANDAAADEDLFADGLMLSEIAAGTRRTVVLKLTVGAGIGDILLSPQLSADAAAILGLGAVRVKRGAAPPMIGPVERPFYELDPDEDADEPLAALPTIAAVRKPEYLAPTDEPADQTAVMPPVLLSEPRRALRRRAEPEPPAAPKTFLSPEVFDAPQPAPQPDVAPEAFVAPPPVAAPRAVVAPQPVVAPEAFVAPTPVAAPRAVPAPQPVAAPEAFVAPTPVVTPRAVVARQPVVAPRTVATPQPVGAPPSVAAPQPVVAPEAFVAPEPLAAPQPAAAPRAAVAVQPVVAPRTVAAPQPVVAPRALVAPETEVTAEADVGLKPVAATNPVLRIIPVVTPEAVVTTKSVATTRPVVTTKPVVRAYAVAVEPGSTTRLPVKQTRPAEPLGNVRGSFDLVVDRHPVGTEPTFAHGKVITYESTAAANSDVASKAAVRQPAELARRVLWPEPILAPEPMPALEPMPAPEQVLAAEPALAPQPELTSELVLSDGPQTARDAIAPRELTVTPEAVVLPREPAVAAPRVIATKAIIIPEPDSAESDAESTTGEQSGFTNLLPSTTEPLVAKSHFVELEAPGRSGQGASNPPAAERRLASVDMPARDWAPPAPKLEAPLLPRTAIAAKPPLRAVYGDDLASAQSIADSFAAHIVEAVAPVEEGIFVAGRGGPMLTVRLDRKRLATLTRLFSGQNLGMIGHYLLLNALAATDPLPGDASDTTIAAFIAQQEQLLSRALIASRLGKVPSPESLAAELPRFPPELTIHAERCKFEPPAPGEAILVRAFQTNEIAFLERTIAHDKTSPFLAASRLFVGLCARDAAVGADDVRRSVRDALSAYAALATAEITRIFLRAKLSRTPVPFKITDRAFDDTARTLLAALARLIT